jgi:hypothetical protein
MLATRLSLTSTTGLALDPRCKERYRKEKRRHIICSRWMGVFARGFSSTTPPSAPSPPWTHPPSHHLDGRPSPRLTVTGTNGPSFV